MQARHTLRIATRGSKLSLAQTQLVADLLRDRWPRLTLSIVTVETLGDRHRDVPLASFRGPDGIFTRGIEAEVLAGQADVALHSLKDVPTTSREELVLAAFPPRGDPRDALVSPESGGFDDLPSGARIGTSSPRRAAQILALRSDLQVAEIRGNVDSRLRKVRSGEVDAIVLAAAGLERLGLRDAISEYLPTERFTPAVGQGALVAQCRADDQTTIHLLMAIDDGPTRAEVTAERAFLQAIGGGCRVPVAANARVVGERLDLRAFIAAADGRTVLTANAGGATERAAEIGRELGAKLLTDARASSIVELGRV